LGAKGPHWGFEKVKEAPEILDDDKPSDVTNKNLVKSLQGPESEDLGAAERS
jgi:hypothetical protein